MIYYDGVIFSLQKSGGVSVLFREIFDRLPEHSYALKVPKLGTPWSRYCDVNVPLDSYEIFHSTYYRVPAVRGAKVVTTVHDFTYERFSRGPARWVHSWQKRRAVERADAIICVSESTKRDLLEFFGQHLDEKISVVHNGVSTDYHQLAGEEPSEQALFVGTRAGYKNFANAVVAVAALKDLRLTCVGGGPFNETEIRLLDRHLPGRYCHAGYLDNSELNILYNRSICLLYPSLYEGFGIPVLEAMRAGCPVVAVGVSSVPEVAGDAALLLERGEVEEMVSALEFLKVAENRCHFQAQGLVQAQKFSWDLTFNETVAVYEKLTGRLLNGR